MRAETDVGVMAASTPEKPAMEAVLSSQSPAAEPKAAMSAMLSGRASEAGEKPQLETHVVASKAADGMKWNKDTDGPALCVFTKKPVQMVQGARVGFVRRNWAVTKVQRHYIAEMTAKYDLDEAGGMLMDGGSYGITELVKQANSEVRHHENTHSSFSSCACCNAFASHSAVRIRTRRRRNSSSELCGASTALWASHRVGRRWRWRGI